MFDIPDIAVNKYDVSNNNDMISSKVKSLYLKLEIAKYNYLILLSDIVEIKKTNLITPIFVKAANDRKIYGTFYYQHKIIPVYKLIINRDSSEINIYINNSTEDKHNIVLNKYYNLLIVQHEDYYGFVIDDVTKSEIIDINFAKSINVSEKYDIIDIKKLINNIKD